MNTSLGFTDLFPLLLSAAFLLWFLRRVIKHGGFTAALFPAPIRTTVGEVRGAGPSMIKTVMKVHLLDAEPFSGQDIGLEVKSTSIASYDMLPITLSDSEAQSLIVLLQRAVRRDEGPHNPLREKYAKIFAERRTG